ncbi:unnamed protein product [Brachionus calyciflorus]|uniref:Uncharacterized protein n=1 Tax=Brachionus calyciflorus TaxID=104777 RepID=A0A813Z013_9BILA|nr:unnamed protein product [Brachionus calyciflorus]
MDNSVNDILEDSNSKTWNQIFALDHRKAKSLAYSLNKVLAAFKDYNEKLIKISESEDSIDVRRESSAKAKNDYEEQYKKIKNTKLEFENTSLDETEVKKTEKITALISELDKKNSELDRITNSVGGRLAGHLAG